jgi:hypothetical protein
MTLLVENAVLRAGALRGIWCWVTSVGALSCDEVLRSMASCSQEYARMNNEQLSRDDSRMEIVSLEFVLKVGSCRVASAEVNAG